MTVEKAIYKIGEILQLLSASFERNRLEGTEMRLEMENGERSRMSVFEMFSKYNTAEWAEEHMSLLEELVSFLETRDAEENVFFKEGYDDIYGIAYYEAFSNKAVVVLHCEHPDDEGPFMIICLPRHIISSLANLS